MMKKIRELMERREAGEKGFTLIELLVVIIIIGILAAIAIPLFMNQQKSAIDSATQSDVRNVATNIETLRVKEPTSTDYGFTADGTGTPAASISAPDGGGTVFVHLGGEAVEVSLSDGTDISVAVGDADGDTAVDSAADGFIILGGNDDGNNTIDGDPVEYDSANGGLQ